MTARNPTDVPTRQDKKGYEMKISEYVSVGHPDKVADYISEYILDRLLEIDPDVRYALEVQIKDNYVTLGGEITTSAKLSEPCWYNWTKEALAEIGYTQEYCDRWGSENTIVPSQLQVVAHISKQSPDIAQLHLKEPRYAERCLKGLWG